ncbi:methyltransferase domain-containing protein [Patescibacteria group bacterium]|nr:methyltransferase domain-containing protein [Patescibacteria group bacterium]
MAYLLFPGRHLLTTAFQSDYLWSILRLPINKLELLGEYKGDGEDKIDTIIFAVTSANQENSRYNPIPFHMRSIELDRFSEDYRNALGVKTEIVAIPHFHPNEHFGEYILKEYSEKTENQTVLTPKNTIVLCSTLALIQQYQKLGFAVLTSEYDVKEEKLKSKTPIDYLRLFASSEGEWEMNAEFTTGVSKATQKFWKDFPSVPTKILRLWKDPLLTEEGSLTKTRNYSTYAQGMGHTALLDAKYKDINQSVKTGKIVDEGCADGALMTLLAKDFSDSDIIGIEITSEFTARCLERQRAGEFGGTFVHFHQRNLMDKIFEDNSIDTTICNSTTHEIWSYGDREESLFKYLKLKFDQLSKNGRLIIRDVVGPEDKEKIVYLELNDRDGSNDNIFKICSNQDELRDHLSGLSTSARFIRFTEDYLKDMREGERRGDETKIKFEKTIIDNKNYFVLRLKDAMEFLTKKDYVDNWQSELNEEFAFWSFSEWKDILRKIGFHIIENPNELERSSRAFGISWIVDNRLKGKGTIYTKDGNSLNVLPYPPTNMVIIATKEGTFDN